MEEQHKPGQTSEPQVAMYDQPFLGEDSRDLDRIFSDAAAKIRDARRREAGLDYDMIQRRRNQLIASGELVLDQTGVYRPRSSAENQ